MASWYPTVRVKQEYCNCNDVSKNLSKKVLGHKFILSDYCEDASTQTDCQSQANTFTIFKPATSISQMDFTEKPVSKLKAPCFESPPLRRTNHCYKNKSPNTVKVLMEKHRMNEKLRHHCLNEQLYMICKIIPGFDEEGKETKVVMMQRIISYIAYLENTIKYLSNALNVKVDQGRSLLTKGVEDLNWSNLLMRNCASINSEDSRDSQISTLSLSRRLNLTTPMIDSSYGCASWESCVVSNSSLSTNQTDSEASDISIKQEICYEDENRDDHFDWFVEAKIENYSQADQFESVFGSSGFDQSAFQVPPSPLEVSLTDLETCELEWLGSPDKRVKVERVENFGIKIDPEFLQEPVNEFSHADIVSPDQVLPQTSIKRKRTDSSSSYSDYQDQTTLVENLPLENVSECLYENEGNDKEDFHIVPHSVKRKQSTPKRNPFVDMANIPIGILLNDSFIQLDNSKEIPMASNFMEVKSTTTSDNKIHTEEQEDSPKKALIKIREKVIEDASKLTTTSKLDLRKSSWLNGFMMYSKVHRRKFIRENPGVHTAQISKLMGQVWRDMTNEQQHLYREYARMCSQELQKVLNSKVTHPETRDIL